MANKRVLKKRKFVEKPERVNEEKLVDLVAGYGQQNEVMFCGLYLLLSKGNNIQRRYAKSMAGSVNIIVSRCNRFANEI